MTVSILFFSLNADLETSLNSDTHLTLWFTQSASTTSLTCFILRPFIFRCKVVICIRDADSYLHWFEELLRPFKASQCYSLIYKTTHYLSHFKAVNQRQGHYLWKFTYKALCKSRPSSLNRFISLSLCSCDGQMCIFF